MNTIRPDGWSRRSLHEATSARFRAYTTGRKFVDRVRRTARLHRWSWSFRKAAAARRMERFGLDVRKGHGRAKAQRIMRNARKAERA